MEGLACLVPLFLRFKLGLCPGRWHLTGCLHHSCPASECYESLSARISTGGRSASALQRRPACWLRGRVMWWKGAFDHGIEHR